MDSQPAPALSIVDQARQRAAEEKLHPANSGETTSDVQMETAQPVEDENDNAVSTGEGADEPPAQTTAVNMSEILAERCPDLTAEVLKSQVSENAHSDDEEDAEQAASAWPEYFEPGRYEGVPNEVYHAANGISSTMVKDARVSLMYFEARHVSKTIQKVRSPVLDMGNLVHALALQPDQLEKNSVSSRKSRKAPSPLRRRSAHLSTNTTTGFRFYSAQMTSKDTWRNTTRTCPPRFPWVHQLKKPARVICLYLLSSSALKTVRSKPPPQ